MIPSAASQYNAAITLEEDHLDSRQTAGDPGMSDQLHVEQEWDQVLAGGMAGRSQLASLYSELRQAPRKAEAPPACHTRTRQQADWEWAASPAQHSDPGASHAGPYREHRRGPTPCVEYQPAVDEAGQSAMQAALLCQILQHSQLQVQQHQQEQRVQMARQAAGQAEAPTGSGRPPACVGSLQEDLSQSMDAWRSARQAAGSARPCPGRAPGHSFRDPCQLPPAQLSTMGPGSLPSSTPPRERAAAEPPRSSSAEGPTRNTRVGRAHGSLPGPAPAQHAEMLPARFVAAAAPARRPSEARQPGGPPGMPYVPAHDLNSHAKQIQPCHCKKSMCLKLYCDCFASGHYCGDTCVCHNCHNTQDHKDLVTQTIAYTRSRNPASFEAKRALARGEHIKGCNCKNSRCLKKYCECFLAKARCSGMCRCIGCANQAPNAAEPDQPNKAARVAPFGPSGLRAQAAVVAPSKERFPLPKALAMDPSNGARQAPDLVPGMPSHAVHAERPPPLPEVYVLKASDRGWEAAQTGRVLPNARPPHSAPAQRFPLPSTFVPKPSDMAGEAAHAAQLQPDSLHARPSLKASAERFPLMDACVPKPSAHIREAAEGVAGRRGSVDGTSASEAGTVFGRSATPSPSHEHLPGSLRTSRSVTDDAVSPSMLHRATFPAARFPAPLEQASLPEAPATSAALPPGGPDGSADALKEPEAAVAMSPASAPAVLTEIAACNAGADLPALPSIGPFLKSLGDPLEVADANVTLSLMPKGGDHTSGPPACHISGTPDAGSTLQKTVSDPFNEGEAAEWLLRLG